MEVLTLEKYKRLIVECSRPSDGQIDNFINYLRQCHSWYKHLPLLPPGREFIFFINPNAGKEILTYPDGNVSFNEITFQDRLFHYSMMPTLDYQRQFGYLAYATDVDPSTSNYIYNYSEDEENMALAYFESRKPIIYNEFGNSARIPLEIIKIGSIRLTALIHRRTYNLRCCRLLEIAESGDMEWLQDPHKSETLENLRILCAKKKEELNQRHRYGIPIQYRTKLRELTGEERLDRINGVDADFKLLLKPEVDRLLNSIKVAIIKMLDLIFCNHKILQ